MSPCLFTRASAAHNLALSANFAVDFDLRKAQGDFRHQTTAAGDLPVKVSGDRGPHLLPLQRTAVARAGLETGGRSRGMSPLISGGTDKHVSVERASGPDSINRHSVYGVAFNLGADEINGKHMQNEPRLDAVSGRIQRRESGRAVPDRTDASVATGLPAQAERDHERMLPDWAHAYWNRVNLEEAAQFAPLCPHCIRGITPDEDICEHCMGEGRVLP